MLSAFSRKAKIKILGLNKGDREKSAIDCVRKGKFVN